jgi:hypothetical protein
MSQNQSGAVGSAQLFSELTKNKNALQVCQSDTALQDVLSGFGYTPEKITYGMQLCDEALEAYNAQIREYGEQYEATDQFHELWDTGKKTYSRSAGLAKIAFQDSTRILTSLGLNGRRKASISGWIEQATLFYTNISAPELMDGMAEFGYSPETLAAEKEQIDGIVAAHSKKMRERGDAQQATRDRDAAVETHFDWMERFRDVAYIALEDQPEWREKVGIFQRS